MQEEEDAKVRRSITLKASQDEDDSNFLNGEDVKIDDNDLALITRNFKRILNKRRFRRGGSINIFPNQFNNVRNKGKQEANKKQADKCFECGNLDTT